MAWKRSPDWLVDAFDELVPHDDRRVERRKMFGYPCVFANGNMFMGLHEDRLALRLPEKAREEFRSRHGATPFEPFEGRAMKEYSVVPRELIENPAELAAWIQRSVDYAASVVKRSKKAGGKTRPGTGDRGRRVSRTGNTK